MMAKAPLLLLPILMGQAAPAPLVPEGVHSLAKGPETICEITGASAVDFERQVQNSPSWNLLVETDRFIAYQSSDNLMQWVFAKSGNNAYPLATCRRAYQQNGAWYMDRKIRCEDSRENCDRAYLEFEMLDEQTKGAIQHAAQQER